MAAWNHPTVLICHDIIFDSGDHLIYHVRKEARQLACEFLFDHLHVVFVRNYRGLEDIIQLEGLQ